MGIESGSHPAQEAAAKAHEEKMERERMMNAEKSALESQTIEVGESENTVEARIAKVLSPEDQATFQRVVESVGGKEKLFDPKGKFLHTTDNLSFAEMLQSGAIITDDVFPGGKQRTPGASFTDGNFPEAMSFQLLYDNVPGGGVEKHLSSDKYAEPLGGSLTEDFVRYFWENHQDVARPYLVEMAKKIPDEALTELGIDANRAVDSEEQALAVSNYFIPKGRGEYGVTLVYDQAKTDELGMEDRGTEGLQKFFEKRSFKPGGVPLSEASAVLVPEARVAEVKQELISRGLSHIDVRPSEELEARRIVEKIKEKRGAR